MGRTLAFNLNGSLFYAEPVKIERKKLYGFNKTFVYDESGLECETANLDEGASGIIPKGGLGMGILSPEGLWVERSTLKAVTMEEEDARLMQSSYDCTTVLNKKVSADYFLDYCITALYELSSGDLARVLGNDIYMFDYCYRASYEPAAAFILAHDGNAFMLTGYEAQFEMLSLPEEITLDEDEEESDDEEIDFSMI